jgi:hypothetical protein
MGPFWGVLKSARAEGANMTLIRVLVVTGAVALASGLNGHAHERENGPSITFGAATVTLGMTVAQVEEHLSEAGRHLQFLSDKQTALVHRNGDNESSEGQVTFSGGVAVYARLKMPDAQSADDLAQEIAGAIESMDTKTCTASNYSAHGTGGGFSQSTFECGLRRFDVMTVQVLGSSVRTVNVNIEIGRVGTN